MNVRRAVRLTLLVEPLAPSFSPSAESLHLREEDLVLCHKAVVHRSRPIVCNSSSSLSSHPGSGSMQVLWLAKDEEAQAPWLYQHLPSSSPFSKLVGIAEDRKSQHGKTMAQMVRTGDRVLVILEACLKKRPKFATRRKSFIEFLEHWGRVKLR